MSFTPTSGAVPMPNVPSIVSAASDSSVAIAPGSIAFALGEGLASGIPGEIFFPLPPTFGGTSVSIVDSTGNPWAAPLFFVSPSEVTFLVPSGVAAGNAQVNVTSPAGTQTALNVQIAPVAPSLFTLGGSGLASAVVIRVDADGTQTVQQVYSTSSGSSLVANPISLGAATDRVYLVLFGTGL